MPRLSVGVLMIVAIAASYGVGRYYSPAQKVGTGRHVRYYVDPMHPNYKSDKPGIAPDCGMPLVPVYAGEAASLPSTSAPEQLPPGAVRIDGATQQLLGIQLASVERSSPALVTRAVGRVVPEDTRVY